MSLRTPNEAYFKGRRALVVVSGLLALSVFSGIVPESTDGSVTVFSLKLKSPDSIPFVFFVVSFYSLWQLWVAWLIQSDEVRGSSVNRIDVFLSFLIGFIAQAVFLWPYLVGALRGLSVDWGLSGAIGGVLASVLSSLAAYALLRGSSVIKKRERAKEAANQIQMSALLLDGVWELVYNPKRKNGSKRIVFLPDGGISDGGNRNENSWRIVDGRLELLNAEGSVFSRFRYVDSRDQFEHTNDEDTLSLRHQVLRRVST